MRNKIKIFKTSTVLIILLISIMAGFIFDLIFVGIDRLLYPDGYDELVEKYSSEYSVPKELVFAVIKAESDFESDAKSSKGAIGLMQIMPSTYEWLAGKLGDPPFSQMLYNPETNIKYGTYYLQYLYSKFGSWEKALMAYNWGEGNLAEFLEENDYTEGDFDSIPVKETRNYVQKVLRYMEKYRELYN